MRGKRPRKQPRMARTDSNKTARSDSIRCSCHQMMPTTQRVHDGLPVILPTVRGTAFSPSSGSQILAWGVTSEGLEAPRRQRSCRLWYRLVPTQNPRGCHALDCETPTVEMYILWSESRFCEATRHNKPATNGSPVSCAHRAPKPQTRANGKNPTRLLSMQVMVCRLLGGLTFKLSRTVFIGFRWIDEIALLSNFLRFDFAGFPGFAVLASLGPASPLMSCHCR